MVCRDFGDWSQRSRRTCCHPKTLFSRTLRLFRRFRFRCFLVFLSRFLAAAFSLVVVSALIIARSFWFDTLGRILGRVSCAWTTSGSLLGLRRGRGFFFSSADELSVSSGFDPVMRWGAFSCSLHIPHFGRGTVKTSLYSRWRVDTPFHADAVLTRSAAQGFARV